MKNKGFTLIELLVIIVIVGLLTSFSLSFFPNVLKRSRDAKRKSFIHNIGVLGVGSRTTNNHPYDALVDGIHDTTADDIRDFLHSQGVDIPPAKNGYQYWYFSTDNDFVVATCSELEDNQLIYFSNGNTYHDVECTTNKKIPTAITGGTYDGGVNFQMTP